MLKILFQNDYGLICNFFQRKGVKPPQKTMYTERKSSGLMNMAISLSAALFVVVLIVSAWIDSSIRVLHVFEAIPFLVTPWLCQRKRQVICWHLPAARSGYGLPV